MRYVFNVIALVGRPVDVYRPIRILKSYRPTLFFNVIAALMTPFVKYSPRCKSSIRNMKIEENLTFASYNSQW